MNRILTALAALAFGLPAQASTVHDFNPNFQPQRSLDGQCYNTHGTANVCFFRITGETFAVSVTEPAQEFAHVFTVNCDTGRYKGFGYMSNEQNSNMATAFCNTGRW